MSSVRGGGFRGRGRGNSAPTAAGRGRTASPRGRGMINNAKRGTPSNRVMTSQPSRPSAYPTPRASQRGNGTRRSPQPSAFGSVQSKGNWQDRYQMLVKAREQERLDAIRQGLIADPDKPRSLSEAITPIGTCQEMCAEFERVQRVVQKDVWDEETDKLLSPYSTIDRAPDEARMVKKFRRAAAGLEEQLPSDLRPPHILKRTCDYLFDEVIGNSPSLAQVHHFVWDRTRAIRNDFSIQQVTKPEELRIAIDCYERIARFHILSLHQLALPDKPYSKYDWQQEREQLDRTLLSLMQYYDDSHGRIDIPNEAEFRAYCVIFQLQDPTPDLEDRVQTWPRNIVEDPRVKTAVEVYMAACNVMDSQGPLKPRANHLIARQDWQRFWELVESKKVSYLMGCVAEIYFNLVRRMVLNALFRTFRMKINTATVDWTLDTLCEILAFDDGDEVYAYCERFGFTFQEREDGQTYLDLTSVKGRTLPEPSAGIPKQSKSGLVEQKRHGRILPAVINGLSVKQAYDQGMIKEEEDAEPMEASGGDGEAVEDDMGDGDDGSSLFIPEKKEPQNPFGQSSSPFMTAGTSAKPSPFTRDNPFQLKGEQTSVKGNNAKPSPFSNGSALSTFGKPSSMEENASTFKSGDGFNPLSNATGQSSSIFSTGNSGPKSVSFQDQVPNPAITTSSPFKTPFNAFSDRSNTPTKATEATAPTFPFAQPPASQGIFTNPPQSTQNTPSTAPSLFAKPSLPTQSPSTSSQSIFSKPLESIPTTPQFSFSTSSQPGPSPVAPPRSFEDNTTQQSPMSPAKPEVPSFTALQTQTPSPFVPPAGPSDITPSPVTTQPPQFSSAPTPPTSTSHSSSPTSPNLGASVKRASFSTDNKPKKPSPLSNSITATEDGSAATSSEPQGHNQSFVAQSKSDEQLKQPVQRNPAEVYDAYLTRLTEEVLHNPIDGLLKEYVEFAVHKAFLAVQDAITTEQDNQEADEYRQFRLYEKYGQLWREIFWRKRLAKTGRARRERRLRRLKQSESQDFDNNNSLHGSHFQLGSSAAASALDLSRGKFSKYAKMGQSQSNSKMAGAWPEDDYAEVVNEPAYPAADSHEEVDDDHKPSSPLDTENAQRKAPRGTSPFPPVYAPSEKLGNHSYMSSNRPNGTRQSYSSPPVRGSGRQSHSPKPMVSATEAWEGYEMPGSSMSRSRNGLDGSAYIDHPTNDFYNPNNIPVKDTTVSSYWRNKAAGVHAADKLTSTRGAKHRSDSAHSAPALRSPSTAAAAYGFAPRGTKRRSEESHTAQTTPPSQRQAFKSRSIKQDNETRGTKRQFSEQHSQETSPPALRSTHTSNSIGRDEQLDAQIARSRMATAQFTKGTELMKAEWLQFQEQLRNSPGAFGSTISTPASPVNHRAREVSPVFINNTIEDSRPVPAATQFDGIAASINGDLGGPISMPELEIKAQFEEPTPVLAAGLSEDSPVVIVEDVESVKSPSAAQEDEDAATSDGASSSNGPEEDDLVELAPDGTEEDVKASRQYYSDGPIPSIEPTDDEELVDDDSDDNGLFDDEDPGTEYRDFVNYMNSGFGGAFYLDPEIKHPAEIRAEKRRLAKEALYEDVKSVCSDKDRAGVDEDSEYEYAAEQDGKAQDVEDQDTEDHDAYDEDPDEHDAEDEVYEDEEEEEFDYTDHGVQTYQSYSRRPVYNDSMAKDQPYDEDYDEYDEVTEEQHYPYHGDGEDEESDEEYDEDDEDAKPYIQPERPDYDSEDYDEDHEDAYGNVQPNGNSAFTSASKPYSTSSSWATVNQPAIQPNSALQAIGNTADEAIELSD